MTLPEWLPTDAQRELVNSPGSRFVEACPGSGKTKAIVARFERLASSRRRRGVGLLSFTNAAVDEVVSRCADPKNLDPPNFIGTFDAFINRFITGPYLASRFGRYPRFVDSWESIPGAEFRIAGMPNGVHFPLEAFDWDDAGAFRFDARRASGQWVNALRVAYANASAAVDTRAEETRRRLIAERHLVSASASRHTALRLLESPTSRAKWIALLAGRFEELIVDEAQDCGSEELAVLRAAHEAGVAIVAVADLDQAIFEFRRADPTKVREFAEVLGAGTRLGGNFRSSPAICAAAASLRLTAEVDEPLGPLREHTSPVRIITFSSAASVSEAVSAILAEERIPKNSCKVLAHRRRDAAASAGADAVTAPPSARAVLRFAAARLTLASDGDVARRQRAMQQAERALLNLAESTDPDPHSTESLAEHLGVSLRWLRNAATTVVFGADPSAGRETYTAEVRRMVASLRWPSTINLPNLNQRLATPVEGAWASLALAPVEAMPWSTIHAAKGREFQAVVLVVPQRLTPDDNGSTCLDLIETGRDGESRRVLYVGATRAKQLLIVASHVDHADRVSALFESRPA